MEVKLRKPFSIVSLPLLGVLYRNWCAKNQPKIFRKLNRFLFRIAYKYGMGGLGVFNLSERSVTFNIRNTQFHSIYCQHVNGVYEPEVAWAVDYFLPEDGVFYDIGSNFGYFSLYAASRPGFKGEIYAFEPNPEVFEDLKSCINQAGYTNIQPVNAAITQEPGEVVLNLPDGIQSGYGSISDNVTIGKSFHIPGVRLDDMKLLPPDLIKMDVEGFELQVINSAAAYIEQCKPVIIFESWMNGSNDTFEVMKKLKNYGYEFIYPKIEKDNVGRMVIEIAPVDLGNRREFRDGVNLVALLPETLKGMRLQNVR